MTYQKYLNGESLYGDSFSQEEIKKWYTEEAEGYANLGSRESSMYEYGYHEINCMHGFSKLKHVSIFENALGMGL